MVRIREKSDVYSFGVVLLEIITGKRPIIEACVAEEEGQHVIGWVRQKLKSKRDPREIVDSKLQGLPDTHIQEMLQALGIALLCTSHRPDDRPTMKDVAALLREIRTDPSLSSDLPHKPPAPTTAAVHGLSPKTTPHPSSFSSSSALSLLQSSSHNSLALYHLPPS